MIIITLVMGIFIMLGILGKIILDLKISNDELKEYLNRYENSRDEF